MTLRRIRSLLVIFSTTLAGLCGAPDGIAQPAQVPLHLSWEVRNGFRLFREEKDFQLHAEALRGHSVLESEQMLARQSDGRGWARNMLGRLCIDAAGRIADPCVRDGESEDYLAPVDHHVTVRLSGADGAACAWTFDDGEAAPRTASGDCAQAINLRARYGRATIVGVEVALPQGSERLSNEIRVRDLLIVGLGDSVAAGEGNPDRAVSLSDDGFCFRQFIGTARSEYYRPGRAGFKGDKSCESVRAAGNSTEEWNRFAARWLNAACHRSLYGYQLRTALALAAGNPHIAVTFVPLACSGASIDGGLFNAQQARELDCGAGKCPATVPSQLTQLAALLDVARQRDSSRRLDLLLLTIGANDVGFSGLVADVLIEEPSARALFQRGGLIGSVEDAQTVLDGKLLRDFARLRAALHPLVGDLARVLYVSYPPPALASDGAPCPGSRDGFDVHPAFSADGERLRRASDFVQNRFLPRLMELASCTGGVLCGDPAMDRMTFVDTHQVAFAGHGLCARADTDPAFDHECFSVSGESFVTSPVEGARTPLACRHHASEFRAYAPRARWMRTANDSYFAAMTYPQGSSATLQPSDIHDATWGLLSAVYGGAVHPSAEGHAAMADAAAAIARGVLHLEAPLDTISAAPLPTPDAQPSQQP